MPDETKPWDKPLPFDSKLAATLRAARHHLQQNDVQPLTADYFACLGSGLEIGTQLGGVKEIEGFPISRENLEREKLIYVWGKRKGVVMRHPSVNVNLNLTPIRYLDF